MDFASLMSSQISKAKAPPPAANSDSTKSKYLRRSDLEAARQTAYAAELAKIETERENRLAKKRKHEEEEAERDKLREDKRRRLAEESRARREEEEKRQERLRRKRLGLPDLPEDGPDSKEGPPLADGEEDIPEADLLAKLRELDEPALLFGESHRSRLRRYRKVTQRLLTPKLSDGPIPTTLELVAETEMKVPDSVPAEGSAERVFLFRQLASYFTMVLREWEVALARRETSVKESYPGKAAYNAMVQSRENMRPLFKKFEKGDVEEGVLEPVVEIVRCAQGRRYVDANNGYLRLSIGKA